MQVNSAPYDWRLNTQTELNVRMIFLVILNILYSFTKCPVHTRDVKHTKVAFLRSYLSSIHSNPGDRKWANTVRGATAAAHAFSCSLDVRPRTARRRGGGRRGANSARWPATRKTTAGCRAATISLGLVIVAASVSRGAQAVQGYFSLGLSK